MRTRSKISAITGAVLAAVLTGCAGGGGDSSDTTSLTFVGFGGDTQDLQAQAFQEPFTAETGISFQNDSPAEHAKLKAMVEAGNVPWDVLLITPAAANQYCGLYLEELSAEVMSDVALAEGAEGTECSIPVYFGQVMFVYNEEQYEGSSPTSIADFFNVEEFPGTRMLPPELETGMLELALVADGVAPEDLYPLDVDRALAKLDTIRDHVVFAESYGQMEQAMSDGTVDMALSPETRFSYLLRAGQPWAAVWDYTAILVGQAAIPKGSPNKDRAEEFLAFMLTTGPQETAAELTTHGAVTTDAQPEFDEFQNAAIAFVDDADRGALIHVDGEWWSENLDDTVNQYVAWQVG